MIKTKRGESQRAMRRASQAIGSASAELVGGENGVQRKIRETLLRGLGRWLASTGMTQTQAAKVLNVTQARVSDIKRGKIHQFSLDLLVRLADRAGLGPRMRLTRKGTRRASPAD
jgi:predicted XRE-type DNA-binding protein